VLAFFGFVCLILLWLFCGFGLGLVLLVVVAWLRLFWRVCLLVWVRFLFGLGWIIVLRYCVLCFVLDLE